MEPKTQVELQLGHMCNNRCVFCVSGQETALGRAGPMERSPLLAMLHEARATGAKKVTLLGGEPTLQPGFLDVVREAARLGFEEIVVFTNGVKTARPEFVDEVIAAGEGKVTWRLSFQGGDREAHELTTRKPGSFDRLVATLRNLRERGQDISVNMCVVSSNHASVAAFPALLAPYGVRQLHLDMMRPLDAGARSEDELRATIPHYPAMTPALEAMVAGFPPGFDANVGNLPYCIAPKIARWIHHDGEYTQTISVDGDSGHSRPWDKYLTKRRDKKKPPSCATCAFEGRCSGVFDAYAKFYGLDDLKPISAEQLVQIDPERRLLSLHLRARLASWAPPAPFRSVSFDDRDDRELKVLLEDGGTRLVLALREPGPGLASTDLGSLHLLRAEGDRAVIEAGLRAVWGAFSEGQRVLHPLGEEAFERVGRSVAARLSRLRGRAPFGRLSWRGVRVHERGARAEVELEGPAGEVAVLWLAEAAGKASGGYRVERGEPTQALVEGLREAIAALRDPA